MIESNLIAFFYIIIKKFVKISRLYEYQFGSYNKIRVLDLDLDLDELFDSLVVPKLFITVLVKKNTDVFN